MGRSVIFPYVLIGMTLYALMIGLPDKRLVAQFKLSSLIISLVSMMTIWPMAIPLWIKAWRETG